MARRDKFSGLTADDVPLEVTPEAMSPRCIAHPDALYRPGFGHAGGGWGSYAVCEAPGCEAVFAKRGMKP